MLSRTERILLALKDGPLNAVQAAEKVGCDVVQARNSLADLQNRILARAVTTARPKSYRLTTYGAERAQAYEGAK